MICLVVRIAEWMKERKKEGERDEDESIFLQSV
jgi:hypothetical protein